MPLRKTKLPALFPDGWVVTDTSKKDWKLGKKLGQGGFGLIYLASPACDARVRDDAAYVIKVEDHQNGPLFCELKFYQRAAKQDDVSKWIHRHNLDYLGIPKYWGSGETTFNSISYRFMVLDRLGSDLYNVQKSNNNKLPLQAVLQVAVRMLDVLEYIHEHEYVHGDIKAGNILCHLSDPSKVYLADYGLSYRYCPDGNHKEYKEDPRKCHNGTLEFTSLDAHRGAAASRRGDLEILSFCMLHWLSGRLPWDQDLKVPANVQAAKQKLMDELPNSVTAWLGQGDGCTDIAKFMVEVRTLQYNVTPNYKRLKGILLKALESSGTRLGAPLIFSSHRSTLRRPPAAKTKTQIEELKAHQNKVNDEEDHTKHPKSCPSPKPHWLQKTSKVKKTNGVGTVNTDDDDDSVGGATYGKSTNVERSRFDLKVGYVGTHKPMETENCNTSQNNNCAFNRNLGVHKAKTYWKEWKAPIRNPKSPHQNWKGKTYWEEPLRDPLSQHRHQKGSTYWEEEPLKEPDSLHQDSQDIYKYGLIITVLLFMIYWLIYKV